MNTQRGSATVWTLCAAALLTAMCWVVAIRCSAVLARHRAESAADAAALAAAGRIGIDAAACSWAGAAALANGAVLDRCELRLAPDGRSGIVRVGVVETLRVPLVGRIAITASARAERAG